MIIEFGESQPCNFCWQSLIILLVRGLHNFAIRLHNILALDVVDIENVVPEVKLVPGHLLAQAALYVLGHAVHPDGVIDSTYKPKATNGKTINRVGRLNNTTYCHF